MDNKLKAELKTFRRFLKNKFNRRLILVFSLFLLIAGLTFRLLALQVEQTLIERNFIRQQKMVETGSKSINSLLYIMNHALVELADKIDIEGDIQQSLDNFIIKWQKTPITSIAFVNESGIRQAIVTTRTEPIKAEVDVSEIESFYWAKQAKQGEVHIGEAIMPSGIEEPIYIIPVVTPIIREGQFKGALVIPINVSYLAEEYLNPLRVTDSTRVYLVKSDGTLVYGSIKSLSGVNYYEILDQRDFPEKEKSKKDLSRALESGKEGRLDIKLPDEQKEGRITRFLVSYAPVKENDDKCFLAIATPIDHILNLYKPFLKSLGLGIVMMTCCVLALIALIIFTWRTVQRDSFEDGFKAGKKYSKGK